MSVYHEFEDVDAFTVGAVGRPGDRTFFLQARRGPSRVTIKCEKQQAAGIAEHLRRILSDLPDPTERPVPAAMQLTDPADPVFVLGPVGLGYDRSSDRVVLQLEEMPDLDEEGAPIEGTTGTVRVFITRHQAHAFCQHADSVVAAGRPTCIWCSRPVDPDGHPCARMN